MKQIPAEPPIHRQHKSIKKITRDVWLMHFGTDPENTPESEVDRVCEEMGIKALMVTSGLKIKPNK